MIFASLSPGVTVLGIIGVYLAIVLGVGLLSHRLFRGTSEDYMLASHTIGPFLLLMSLFGTTMTAFALVGSTGEAFVEGVGVYGMLASSSGIIHSLCFFLVGVKVWSLGRRYGYRTQSQFFRDRLESQHIQMVLFPVLVGLVIPYLLLGIVGAGATIHGVTKGAFPDVFPDTHGAVPRWLGSAVICGVVLAYVFYGGMRGTAWANAFQTAVFMILGVVTFVVIAYQLGGQENLLANMRAASQAVSAEYLTREHIPKMQFITYMFIPLSVAMFPHLFQHWLTARNANTFKLPVVLHPIFIMIVWAPCVLVGVWATTELAAVPETVRPNAVLAYLVQKLAGPWLGGLLTAGVLAAIMSSLDSQFLCLGTMFTEDVVRYHRRKKPLTDRQTLLLARIFIVGVVVVSFLLSLPEAPRVFQLGVWCFSGFSSLFPLVIAALYWRRLTKAGAYACILTAALVWGVLFWHSGFAANANYSLFGMMPVTVILACSTAAMIGVSLVTRPPSAATLERFFPREGLTVADSPAAAPPDRQPEPAAQRAET